MLPNFSLCYRGKDVRSPLKVLKDSPEIIPVVASGVVALAMASYVLGKKLLYDPDVLIKKMAPATWEEDMERLKKESK